MAFEQDRSAGIPTRVGEPAPMPPICDPSLKAAESAALVRRAYKMERRAAVDDERRRQDHLAEYR